MYNVAVITQSWMNGVRQGQLKVFLHPRHLGEDKKEKVGSVLFLCFWKN